jgi:hypothetical protein
VQEKENTGIGPNESIMAASDYYNSRIHVSHDDDQQQHLLSPNMSSPGLSSGHPSPLKPLHLLSVQETPYQHQSHDIEDLNHFKDASNQDAVSFPPPSPNQTPIF